MSLLLQALQRQAGASSAPNAEPLPPGVAVPAPPPAAEVPLTPPEPGHSTPNEHARQTERSPTAHRSPTPEAPFEASLLPLAPPPPDSRSAPLTPGTPIDPDEETAWSVTLDAEPTPGAESSVPPDPPAPAAITPEFPPLAFDLTEKSPVPLREPAPTPESAPVTSRSDPDVSLASSEPPLGAQDEGMNPAPRVPAAPAEPVPAPAPELPRPASVAPQTIPPSQQAAATLIQATEKPRRPRVVWLGGAAFILAVLVAGIFTLWDVLFPPAPLVLPQVVSQAPTTQAPPEAPQPAANAEPISSTAQPASGSASAAADGNPLPAASDPEPTGKARASKAAAIPKPPPSAGQTAAGSEPEPGRAAAGGAAPPQDPALAGVVLQPDETQPWRQRAEAAQRAGDWLQAQRAYEAWLQQRPNDPVALWGLATALHRQQQWAAAFQAYQRAARLWPEQPALRSAALAVLAQMDPEQAESRLRDWLQAVPEDAAAHAALGTLLGRQNRWSEALGYLERAVTLEPAYALYHYNLAVAHDRLYRTADAIRHYRRSLVLRDPQLPEREIRERLAILSAMTSDSTETP